MIVLSCSTAQTIQPGGEALFNVTAFRSGCDTFRQSATGALHLRCGVYDIAFTGNVSGDANTQPNLVIAVDGTPLPETVMAASISVDTDVFNVHASTIARNCVNGATVSVRNAGTTDVTLAQNPALTVERRA